METTTTRRELAFWAALVAMFAAGARPAAAEPARADAPLRFGLLGGLVVPVAPPGDGLHATLADVAFAPDGSWTVTPYAFRDGRNRDEDVMDFSREDLEPIAGPAGGSARDLAEALLEASARCRAGRGR